MKVLGRDDAAERPLASFELEAALARLGQVEASGEQAEDQAGPAASGANSTLQRFGSAFAIAVVAAVFAANGHIGSPASFAAGFRPALVVAASLSLIGAITALGVQSRRAPLRSALSLADAA